MNFRTFYWQPTKMEVHVKLSQCLLRRRTDSTLMAPLSPEFGIGRKKNFINFVVLSLLYLCSFYYNIYNNITNQCRTAVLTGNLLTLISVITEMPMSRRNKYT
jgi:hypothetical protein